MEHGAVAIAKNSPFHNCVIGDLAVIESEAVVDFVLIKTSNH